MSHCKNVWGLCVCVCVCVCVCARAHVCMRTSHEVCVYAYAQELRLHHMHLWPTVLLSCVWLCCSVCSSAQPAACSARWSCGLCTASCTSEAWEHRTHSQVTSKSFNFAAKHKLPFFFVSASDGTNVVKIFQLAIRTGIKYQAEPKEDFYQEVCTPWGLPVLLVLFEVRACSA